MIRVTVELGALPGFQGIFDRERVETKFFCDVIQIFRLRPAQIDPHKCVRIAEVVRDVLDREVLLLQPAVAVDAGTVHLAGCRTGRHAHLDALVSRTFNRALRGLRWSRLHVPGYRPGPPRVRLRQ